MSVTNDAKKEFSLSNDVEKVEPQESDFVDDDLLNEEELSDVNGGFNVSNLLGDAPQETIKALKSVGDGLNREGERHGREIAKMFWNND